MLSLTDPGLLDLLTGSDTRKLSNHEIARCTGDHHYVGGFRTAAAATKWTSPNPAGSVGPDLDPSPTGLPVIPGWPSSVSLTRRGHIVPGMPPALNSYNCLVKTSPREQTKFVDAIGLHYLCEAASWDRRETFLRVIHDTRDCSRGGSRCLYGYWSAPCSAAAIKYVRRP
jgi:hypothetical protein